MLISFTTSSIVSEGLAMAKAFPQKMSKTSAPITRVLIRNFIIFLPPFFMFMFLRNLSLFVFYLRKISGWRKGEALKTNNLKSPSILD
jgi:hypothetical protein